MKKLQLAALALAASAVGAPAFAQSSVTVFGVVDLAARSVKNNGTQYQLAGSGLTSSRLGFRGVEDLGGGLKAVFWLEGALDPDTGGTGQTWQRRSTLGLQGGFGEVRMGREKNASGLTWEQLDVFADTGMGAVGRLQAANGLIPTGGANASYPRSSNMISYYTPGSTGFSASLNAAAGEGSLGNKHIGGRVAYTAGGLFAVVSYGETQVTPGIDLERLTVGLTYDLKFAKLFGMYATTDAGAADQKNLLVGVSVPVGAAVVMRASYHKMEGGGSISNRDARQFTVGGQYNLSRRTALYANYADIANSGATNLTVATGSPLSNGRDSSGYEFGLRHSF